MSSGEVIGAEALIRWLHPERGVVAPMEFLPAIIDTPFEIVIGKWVIEEALRQIDIWNQHGMPLQVSVNISPAHLQWPHFATQLEEALALHPHIPSQQLQLEVLESSAIGDLSAIGEVIRTCRDALGVSIALDDFGTGYSSLTYLRRLPANTIKIDQSFVRDMIDDPNDYAIVDGVIGLAHAFRREVIAEGVETREHGLMLLSMGCPHAQGYGIARPMPASALPQWAKDYLQDPLWQEFIKNRPSTQATLARLLQIKINRWVSRLEASLRQPPETSPQWPIMDCRKCHSGSWILEARENNLFDPEQLDKIDQMHEELHRTGNVLIHMYQEGNPEKAREGIPLLQATLHEIDKTLDPLIQG
jgi:EAL domain-containing protein (putative c-di-GMP-specific phosphodiesterase class I)